MPVKGVRSVEEKVTKVLDAIRPGLQMDGGDIELVSVADGIVKVRLTGACSGCPMSMMTLQMGVERAIRREIPDIVKVESVPF